jgi:predicted dehydrogenase
MYTAAYMSEDKLKTAVLGLDDNGQLLLETASKIGYFEIQAVADKDTNLAESAADKYKCIPYDDYRQLIIQNQFDCLLVAAGLHSCDRHVKTAMRKKFNVLKLPPLARNFEEAVEFVQLAENENIKFAIANTNHFAQSFIALRDFLQQNRIEQVFLITAVCIVGGQPHPAWQSDPKLAGGGVLLRDCYELINQITSIFGIPQQVYALNTNTASDKQQRLYLTEDTAVLALKFTDSTIGNLIASRAFGQEQKYLKVYGKDKILMVDSTHFTISDPHDNITDQSEYDDDQFILMTKSLENFALGILSPDKNKLSSSGRDNLRNMAVIESAYLSSRTGFVEEPAKILQRAP